MNSQVTMYLAEARQTELRSTAARSRPVLRTSTRSLVDRFRAAGIRWHRRPLATARVAAPTAARSSTVG
jgi:hypothetical protein